jgi:serine/tyrosine/threonine adenylyltransferase
MTANFLSNLLFDNRFVRELPADAIADNYRRQVSGACYSFVSPTPVRAPKLVCAVTEVADLIHLKHEELFTENFTQVFSGNKIIDGMQPHACCYGGHQFGNWAGQLGDGRAINLGEVKNAKGEHWTLQLKGAGPTPYSRTADGLAVLRSSVREFLCSEAMHHLGVPTTRALSLMVTGEHVRRDMLYDGNPELEPGAIVCRVAQSFTRFGNFEILAARNDINLLKRLVDFTIRSDFPYLIADLTEPLDSNIYIAWFDDVCKKTAQMIAHWMRVGFVHGVMNTDNMSILGLTIDYGPYGWLEGYEPDWTPNTTDAQHRRYRFINQPQIALWNLAQLANAIYPLIESVEPLQNSLQMYRDEYAGAWQRDMANKLGLNEYRESDVDLIDQLHLALQTVETDMTIFFRLLSNFDAQFENAVDNRDDEMLISIIESAYYQTPSEAAILAMASWLRLYRERLVQDFIVSGAAHSERKKKMDAVNPKYVLRNYMAQVAIDKATAGDYSEVENLLSLLRHPYSEQPENQHYFSKRPEWARNRVGCSMLSCSS